MLKYFSVVLALIIICPSVHAEFALPSAPPDRPAVVLPRKVLKVSAGKKVFQFDLSVECAVVPNRDDQVSYSVLLGDQHAQKSYPVEPCFVAPRVYAFRYAQVDGIERRMTKYELKAEVVVTDSPIHVQYLMKLNGRVYASKIKQLVVPAEPGSIRVWHGRPNFIFEQIDVAYNEAHQEIQHYSTYGVEDHRLHWQWLANFVHRQLSISDREQFRFLDLGVGDGISLIGLQNTFQLRWDQLLGISAQDFRNRLYPNPVPDQSYRIFNIERLDLRLQRLGLFDFIFSHATWSYLVDPLSTFAMVYDLLKVGGTTLIYFEIEHFDANDVDIEDVVNELQGRGYLIDILPMAHPEMDTHGPMMWMRMQKSASHLHLEFPVDYDAYYRAIREVAKAQVLRSVRFDQY